MEEKLSQIKSIIQSKRLLQPDQTIDIALLNFPNLLSPNLDTNEISKYEDALIPLLYVNNSQLSPQCAIRIANCLVSVYSHNKKYKITNLIQKVKNLPTLPSIYAVGQVIKKCDQNSRPSMSSFAQFLLETKDLLQIASLFTLRQIFKVSGDEVASLADKTYSFAKSHIKDDEENAQLLALKLIRSLVPFEDISTRQLKNAASTGIYHAHTDFAVEIGASIAAAAAKRVISKLPGKTEKITNKIFNEAFGILKKFKDHFQLVFRLFLDLLTPEFVYNNAQRLFDFALSVEPTAISCVNEFFGHDVRSQLIKSLFTAKKPDLRLLKRSAFDEESARKTAEFAETALLSKKKEERLNACAFFVSLALTYPEIALDNLKVAANYIASPPTDKNAVVKYNTMAFLSATILSVIEEKKYAAQTYQEMFSSYIQYASQKVNDDDFAIPMLLLSASLSNFEVSKVAGNAITRFEKALRTDMQNEMKTKSYTEKFAEAALFYLCCIEHESAETITKLCMQQLQRQTPAGRVFLMKLSIKFGMKESFSVFSPFIQPISITRAFTSQLMDLMKVPGDYFKTVKSMPPNFGSLAFIDDPRSFGQEEIILLPSALKLVDKEQVTDQLLNLLQMRYKIVSFTCILQLYKECPEIIPKDFHTHLLKELGARNINQQESEIVAESIAIHCSYNKEAIEATLSFLAKKTTQASCFLEGSIAKYVSLSDNAMTAILYRLQVAVQDKKYIRFALNALRIIYESKSQQLVGMMVGDAQCQILLSTLYTPQCQDPYTLLILSQCVERLVPILLPFLSDEASFNLLYLVISCFKDSVVVYSEELFNLVLRAAIAFSPKLLSCFPPIKYPQGETASNELKLSICGAMADSSQIAPIPDLFDIVPSILILLQRTKDDRAKQLIVASAQSSIRQNPQRMQDWFRLAKEILSSNTMPGFGSAKCEPNIKVKAFALTVMHILLKELRMDQRECLDDLMTSTIHAIELQRTEIHDIAYPILKDVVDAFKNYDSNNILDNYESQLLSAVQNAFPNSCDVASSFIVEYLDFCFSRNCPGNRETLIMSTVEGLKKCRHLSPGFFSISSKVVEISIGMSARFGDNRFITAFNDFMTSIGPCFEDKVVESIRLRTQKCSWEELSSFRVSFSSFYKRLLSCAVYLRQLFTPKVNLATLASFFGFEVATSSESWRVLAGMSGIASALSVPSGNSQLPEELTDVLIHTVCDASCRNSILLRPHIDQFIVKVCLSGVSLRANFDGLVYSCIREKCRAATLSYVLMSNVDLISPLSQSIAIHSVQMVDEKIFTTEEGIAICTIVIENTEELSNVAKEVLLSNNDEFCLTVCRRCIEKQQGCCDAASLARLCRRSIECGGFDLAALLSVKRDPTLAEVLSRGVLSSIMELCDNNEETCATVFDFVSYSSDFLSANLSAVFNCSMKKFLLWCNKDEINKLREVEGDELTNVEKMIYAFLRMFKSIKPTLNAAEINSSDMSLIFSLIKEFSSLENRKVHEEVSKEEEHINEENKDEKLESEEEHINEENKDEKTELEEESAKVEEDAEVKTEEVLENAEN